MNVQVVHQAQRSNRVEPRTKQLLRRLIGEVEAESSFVAVQQDEQNQDREGAVPNRSLSEIMLEIELDGTNYQLILRRLKPIDSLEQAVVLSPREKEVVRLVADGYPTKTIANILDISPWTVSTHLRRVFSKLGVNSRVEMIAAALRLNILH